MQHGVLIFRGVFIFGFYLRNVIGWFRKQVWKVEAISSCGRNEISVIKCVFGRDVWLGSFEWILPAIMQANNKSADMPPKLWFPQDFRGSSSPEDIGSSPDLFELRIHWDPIRNSQNRGFWSILPIHYIAKTMISARFSWIQTEKNSGAAHGSHHLETAQIFTAEEWRLRFSVAAYDTNSRMRVTNLFSNGGCRATWHLGLDRTEI